MTKRLLVLPVSLVAVLGLSVLPAGADNSIGVKDDFFTPKSTTVKRNSIVTFRWLGDAPHNVKVKRGPVTFGSTIKTSGTYKKKMTRAGTYRLECTIHPGMEMTLRVR